MSRAAIGVALVFGRHVNIEWSGAVPDTSLATVVTLSARLNHDTEPAYDYLYLEVERATGWDVAVSRSGGAPSVLRAVRSDAAALLL